METNYNKYSKEQEEIKKQAEALAKELKVYANRFFSSEEGRKYGRQMLAAVKYFQALPVNVSDDYLRYIQAQRDFVDTFVIGLISNETLVNLIKD